MITITFDGGDDRHDLMIDALQRLYLDHGRSGISDDTLRIVVAAADGAVELDLGLRKFRPDPEFAELARAVPGVTAVRVKYAAA